MTVGEAEASTETVVATVDAVVATVVVGDTLG
jgi:hypothetical protein